MMHETPSQAEHVISKLGGINAAARLLGHKSASTVQGWKQRGFVPANRQQEVLDAALAAGIALTRDDFVFHLRGDEGASCVLEADPEPDGDTPPDPATVRAADLACRSVASADAVVCRSGARPDAVNEFEEVA